MKNFKPIVFLVFFSLLNFSCGIVPSAPQKQKPYYPYTVQQPDSQIPGTGDSPSPSPSPSPSASPGGTDPLISMPVRKVGYDSPFTVQVPARRILRVKFTPGVQDQTVEGSGFSPQYSQLGVFISVGSQEQPTPLLGNGLMGEAESSPVMDFSRSIPQECAANDPNCRVAVTLTVRKPNYDYWCFNWGQYCSHTRVWESHPWNGTLQIQTDDTVAAE